MNIEAMNLVACCLDVSMTVANTFWVQNLFRTLRLSSVWLIVLLSYKGHKMGGHKANKGQSWC